MITRAQIRKMSGSTSYFKGMDLYQQERVESFSICEGEEDVVNAVVKGSRGRHYEVQLFYDTVHNRAAHIFCGCPAYETYPGICKHCVAVLMKYADYKERQTTIAEYAAAIEKKRESPKTLDFYFGKEKQPVKKVRKRKTTGSIRELLQQQTLHKTIPVLEKDNYGCIRLEPHLVIENQSIYADFRVGNKRMYVIKDVFEFASMVEQGKEFSYGKALQFVHITETFTRECQALVRFVIKWTQQNRQHFAEPVFYGSSYGTIFKKIRQIPLTVQELEEFLDAAGTMEFPGDIRNMTSRRWKAVSEISHRTLEIQGKEDGIEICTKPYVELKGSRYYLFFDEGKIYRIPRREREAGEELFFRLLNLPQQKAFIEKEDLSVFCSECMEELEQNFSCVITDFQKDQYILEPASFAFYLDMPQQDFITISCMVKYGEAEYSLYDKNAGKGCRDLMRELEVEGVLFTMGNAYDEKNRRMVLAEDENRIYWLLTRGISILQQHGRVYISDTLKKIKITRSPKVWAGVS